MFREIHDAILDRSNKVNFTFCNYINPRRRVQNKIWRQRINVKSCNVDSISCYAHKQEKQFLSFAHTMVLIVKCIWQVTGAGKAESNYEGENKGVDYRQTEYVMKVIIDGQRL